MFKMLILILIPFLLLAQNPKIFSSVGDPLYDDITSLQALSDLYAFKTYKDQMKRFIADVQQLKERGFALDRQKDPDKARAYLAELRVLNQRNVELRRTIKEVMAASIKSDHEARYRQIIRTRHNVFREDPGLKRQIASYEKILKKRAARKARKHDQYLLTSTHLNGTWHTPSQQWTFDGGQLATVKYDGKQKQVNHGTWKIEDQHLVHHVTSIENSYNERNQLIRETETIVYYTLIQIRSGELVVKDIYNETHHLKKQ